MPMIGPEAQLVEYALTEGISLTRMVACATFVE